jgi:hypothetical protein
MSDLVKGCAIVNEDVKKRERKKRRVTDMPGAGFLVFTGKLVDGLNDGPSTVVIRAIPSPKFQSLTAASLNPPVFLSLVREQAILLGKYSDCYRFYGVPLSMQRYAPGGS